MPSLARVILPALLCSVLFGTDLHAAIPHNFIPGSLCYNMPMGPMQEAFDAKGAIGFMLGYKFAEGRHMRYGAKGTWTQMGLGTVDTVDYSQYTLTHVGILLSAQFRFFKHGWTPYVEGDAGMGLLFGSRKIDQVPQRVDDLSEVRFSVAGAVGVLIPVSDVVDVDLAGRYQTTFTSQRFDTFAAHVGIVYALD
jgi:hypothetical protein